MKTASVFLSVLVISTTLSALPSYGWSWKDPLNRKKQAAPLMVAPATATTMGTTQIIRPIKLKKGQYLEKQTDGKIVVKEDFAKAHPYLDGYKNYRRDHPVKYWTFRITKDVTLTTVQIAAPFIARAI